MNKKITFLVIVAVLAAAGAVTALSVNSAGVPTSSSCIAEAGCCTCGAECPCEDCCGGVDGCPCTDCRCDCCAPGCCVAVAK